MDLSKSEDDSPQLTKKGKAIKASKTSKDSKESKDKKESKVKKAKPKKSRSRRYRLIRTKVDRTKTFPLPKALKLLLSISNTKFDASVETNLNLTESGQKY